MFWLARAIFTTIKSTDSKEHRKKGFQEVFCVVASLCLTPSGGERLLDLHSRSSLHPLGELQERQKEEAKWPSFAPLRFYLLLSFASFLFHNVRQLVRKTRCLAGGGVSRRSSVGEKVLWLPCRLAWISTLSRLGRSSPAKAGVGWGVAG